MMYPTQLKIGTAHISLPRQHHHTCTENTFEAQGLAYCSLLVPLLMSSTEFSLSPH